MKKTSNNAIVVLAVVALLLYFFQGCKSRPDPGRIVNSDTARNRVARFQALRDDTSADARLRNTLYYTAEVFTKNNVDAILSQSKCDGIRIYHALDSLGRNVLVIVGVHKIADNNYEDLLPIAMSPAARVNATLYDEQYNVIDADDPNLRCQTNCDKTGLANSPQ